MGFCFIKSSQTLEVAEIAGLQPNWQIIEKKLDAFRYGTRRVVVYLFSGNPKTGELVISFFMLYIKLTSLLN